MFCETFAMLVISTGPGALINGGGRGIMRFSGLEPLTFASKLPTPFSGLADNLPIFVTGGGSGYFFFTQRFKASSGFPGGDTVFKKTLLYELTCGGGGVNTGVNGERADPFSSIILCFFFGGFLPASAGVVILG